MIKPAAVRLLGSRPIWPFLLRRALKARPLTVMCYHTLGPDAGGINGWTTLRAADFRAQLADFRAQYDILSLDDALRGPSEQARAKLVITFDDGDIGLSTHLAPILRDTGVPVTLYIATKQFETGRPFWFDRVVNALQDPGEVALDGFGRWLLPGGGGKAHWEALGPILQALKAAPADQRDDLADQLTAQGTAPEGSALGPMSRDQLTELAALPGVTIGAHTHGHELLDQLPLEAASASVARSRALLQDWSGQEVRHFAFPNGNYTPALCQMVRDLGFASATILEDRTAPADTDPFAIPRISVGRYDSQARVRLRLAGF